jgi:type II secretory pathway component GspD/PulD (secretin)
VHTVHQVYRLKYIDANSVAELFQRSFPNLPLAADSDLNSIAITSNLTVQRRIADAVSQLDVAPAGAAGGGEGGGAAASGIEVVELKAAVPGLQVGPSTTATDIASAVTQALQRSAADLHIVVPLNSTQLVLTGSPYSVKPAKRAVTKLDRPQTMVATDTEVLEIDEGTVKQLGLQSPTATVNSTFTECHQSIPPATPFRAPVSRFPTSNFFRSSAPRFRLPSS